MSATLDLVPCYAPVTCPRCATGTGSWPMRHVENVDDHGYAERERRGVLVCTNPTCGHACVLIVTLIDADQRERRAA